MAEKTLNLKQVSRKFGQLYYNIFAKISLLWPNVSQEFFNFKLTGRGSNLPRSAREGLWNFSLSSLTGCLQGWIQTI